MTDYPYVYVYVVHGYDKLIPNAKLKGDFLFQNSVTISVYASSSAEALTKAKDLIDKPEYRVSQVTEVIDHEELHERMAAKQLQAQQELIKGMNHQQFPKKPWEKSDDEEAIN